MAEETEFAMGAEASCVDGPGGKVIRVIVEPATETVTHLVVEPRHRLGAAGSSLERSRSAQNRRPVYPIGSAHAAK